MAKHVAGARAVLTASLVLACSLPLGAQHAEYSSAHRNGEQVLPQTVTGGRASLRAGLQASRSGVSLVAADFDSDGVQDLLSGYVTASGGALLLQRGSAVALAPTPREWAMQSRGELVAPFAARSEAIELPVRPDLLKTADIHGHGHSDILVAQQRSNTLYLLRSDGRGGFSSPQPLALAGSITSLATWGGPAGDNLIVAGVCGASGCGLQFLDRDGETKAFVATPSAVTAIQTARTDAGSLSDFAFIAGGRVLVLQGDTALHAQPTLETLPVESAAALAPGSYLFDRSGGLQLAVLDSAATLHVFVRAGFNNAAPTAADRLARNQAALVRLNAPLAAPAAKPSARAGSWTEMETLPNVGPGGAGIQMVRGRLSGRDGDDLAVLAGSQYVTVAHTFVREGAQIKTIPVVTMDSTAAPVTAVLATRISADARHGIVALGSGLHPLTVTPPSGGRSITADTFTDAVVTSTAKTACINHTAGCTLRAAVTVANDDQASTGAGTSTIDTIHLNTGTYLISGTAANVTYDSYAAHNPDFNGSVNYHFEVDASVNFVGAGCTMSGTPSVPSACSTVIDANGKDQAFTINYATYYADSSADYNPKTLDVFFSGLTIQNGINLNNPSAAPCSTTGFCNQYGGNIGYTADGPSNLVLQNVLIANGTSQYYSGGGLDVGLVTGSATSGPVEIDNSSFTGNKASLNVNPGGALSVEEAVPIILNSDLFSANTATGNAGAVWAYPQSNVPLTITNSVFSGNIASGGLGGAVAALTSTSISGTTFQGNNAGGGYGGALYLANGSGTASITTSTFTANQITAAYTGGGETYTSDGAGACVLLSNTSGQAAATFRYNRFHNNSLPGGSIGATGLAVGCNDSGSLYGNVTATDNWWGCNPTTAGTSIAGTGCDTAHIGNAGTTPSQVTLNTSPYTTLVLNLSSTSLVQGSTLTATASLGQDSTPAVFTAANDPAFLATPITTFTLTNTAAPTYTPSPSAFSSTAATGTSFAAAVASGVTNASGTGTATLTVDGQTVTKTYTITAPADLTVTSSHPGNFKAGDAADVYTLTATNSGGTATSGTVAVTDTLPSGFTATALSGTGWTCTLGSLTCTRSDTLAASGSYSAITLTVSVGSTNIGNYTNSVAVSGGGETNTSNDTGTDPTIVVGAPTLTESFNPTTVAPNTISTVTFTLGNPAANAVSLTGVAFSDTLPAGLNLVGGSTATTCSGTAVAAGNGFSLSGATIASGATCTVTAQARSASIGSYINTSSTITAANSNAGPTASATLTVNVTPTRLVYTAGPATPIISGGNAGTVSVALEDAAGNIATNNSTASVSLFVTNPGNYSQMYTATAANGVATFDLSAVPLTVAATYTYQASSSGLTSTSTTEVVNPGAAASFFVTGLSNFTAPQMSGSATVVARDANGNIATGFTGTVTLSSTDALATFSPASYAYVAGDAGMHSFTVTFNTAGTQTVTATSGAVTGSQTGILVQDAIWILNTGGTLTRTTDAGVQTTAAGATSGTATFGGLALDNAGDVWSVRSNTNTVQEYTRTGVPVTVAGNSAAGVTAPVSLFIDGVGQVWVANGNNSVSVLSSTGAAVSPGTGYQGGGMSTPTGIVVDSSGSVWLSNGGNNSVTKVFGAAAPVVTPTVTGTANNTLGTRP